MKRIGYFFVAEAFYEKSIVHEIPIIFGHLCFAPTNVEYSFISQRYKFAGYSKDFREIEKGEDIPSYNIIVKRDSNNNIINVYTEELEDSLGEVINEKI